MNKKSEKEPPNYEAISIVLNVKVKKCETLILDQQSSLCN